MLRRLLILCFVFILLLAVGAIALFRWMLHDPHPSTHLAQGALAIRDARVYPSPDEQPIDHASILIRDGRIVAVGANIDIPPGTQTLPCDHCIVMAGFWNTHVHFTQARWAGAAFKPAPALNAGLSDMLTGRGFTTVVDLGSNPFDTVPLRRRIEAGDLLGPFIYTAGAAQYPPQGIPFYLRNTLPKPLQRLMPQPANPDEAAKEEQTNIDRGADLLKLFTGSYVERNSIKPMPLANAQAAVAVAHAHGQLAFAHPSNLTGVLIARDAGVDVLAHAADEAEGVTPEVLQSLIDHHMAMVPTLKMFRTTVTHNPAYLDPIYAEVNKFHSLGGALLFGTDVGYMFDYTTEDEFTGLAMSGLKVLDILRMLTTAPAERFHVDADKGRIAPGKLADLVLLGSDPQDAITNFSDIRLTLRGGTIVYKKP